MISRKMNKKVPNRKRDYFNHYFKMIEITENGNDKLWNRLEEIDSIKDFFLKNYILANIPEKYFNFEFKQIEDQIQKWPKNEKALEIIKKYLGSLEKAREKGIGLYISGPHGVAKTTISIIILKQALREYFKCFFCKSTEIIDFVRSGWYNEDRKYYWNYVVNNTDFMVIDDLARLFELTDTEKIHIDEIFTKRDGSNLSTIITSNHTLDSNHEKLGEALYSNFKERLIEIDIIGNDYRETTINKNLVSEL
jgi:DNA replication protein DnaC